MSNPWPEFKGKRVLVTGGSQGIGLAAAQAFKANGATVLITGTRGSAADYADDLSGFAYIAADFTRPEAAAQVAAAAGAIDVLVNNAGTGRADEYSDSGFRAVIDVNLNAVMALSVALHPALAERNGSVVNIGSLASFLALRETPAYTASKAGLLGLTRALADKWAPDGIRVNMVAPGFIRTRMTEIQRTDADYEKRLLKAVPMRRWGEPEEVAETVLFLASTRAPYITGQSLAIDGGLMLR
ncbi:SDR family oxidoreductase [Sandaracinobacter neustonicus]|uniref:SDR family oxidoreductase n=1 Tax=Sandaracinobacter neustonicus TaxID=1715348 RepID=A0A501XFH8_9SPHN|nr:SDR family oxidoreductase [Sandaracinobacter neustonicus]TPE59087.1 SDR family oxidoreductase [Sandaracinobacter neustonicus]